ncbi:hypothetical protein COCON_G00002790 [Conger conger]|uniref:Uncharacterized protein n=1 Tax=Conger conger TaxID=82655 RepID=A0A9Q1E0U9_CONCO|nr:hypothetical protein COCON_G00002790 [Conger conger]
MLSVSWLARLGFFCSVVLWQIPVSPALSYTSIPLNVTQDSGKVANFLCGVSPETATTRVEFTIHRRHGNYSVLCPGEPMSLPSQGLNGYCEVKGQELRAGWSIAYSSRRDSDTYVVCEPTGLSPTYAYLTVKGNNSYFSAFIGCVVGGFLVILLIFGLAYLGMRRSESLRRCFKGQMTEDDLSTIIED